MASSREQRPGPTSMTIADVVVLIVGVALALSLPWYAHWVQIPQPVMEPRWRIVSAFLEEAIGKASLALVPLMLYRRIRLGGSCRPGELLLVVCASYMLAEQIHRVARFGRDTDGIHADHLYWWTLGVAGAATIGAVAALVLLRAKLSQGVVNGLLVVAIAGAYPWPGPLLEELVYRLMDGYRIPDSSAAEYALFVVFFAIANLVPAVIGAAAIAETIRRRGRTEILAGVGLIMAVVEAALGLLLYLPGYYAPAFPPWNDHLLYVLLAAPATAGLLGWVLFLGLRNRRSRCFASGSTR